jgi:hypothetical protein
VPESVGDVDPTDDGMHPVEADQQFNESMLITFFDRQQNAGALVRIGNRVNEGYAEVTFCLFPPDGGALFQFARAPITTNERFDAGGMQIDVVEPGETLTVTYRGQVAFFDDPKRLADPGRAFKEAPMVAVELAVALHACSPMYGARTGTIGGHYEQHMLVGGTASIGGVGREIVGLGNRGHSWGPRSWHRVHQDWTLWCTFSATLAFAVALTWRTPDAPPDVMGTVFKDGTVRVVVGGSVQGVFEDNGLFHTALAVELRDEAGEVYEIVGRVVRFIPFRHRRGEGSTHIGQGMTEFTLGDQVAYGLSEYLTMVAPTP